MAILYQTSKFISANILAIAILGSTAKFNSRQYFRLYGISSFCRCLKQLGNNHGSLVSILVPELLSTHPFFMGKEPDVDDPACILGGREGKEEREEGGRERGRERERGAS